MEDNNTNENTDFTATREIKEGLTGSGAKVYQVQSTWIDRNWRNRVAITNFETLEAAQSFIKWS